MKLTILGSGTMLPTHKRFPSSFLIESGGKKLLLDCGHGTLARLTEIGIDPREIDALFISHFHTDHCGDAFNLVHARFVGNLYHGRPNELLPMLGPESLKSRFEKWREIFWPEPGETSLVQFHEGTFQFVLGDIAIRTFPVAHVPWFQSVGIRLQVGETDIVYPGDVGTSHDFGDLITQCAGAAVLLIECGSDQPSPNHFTLEQADELVRRAGVKHAFLIHIRPLPEVEERVRLFVAERPRFQLAEDKTILELA